jgi:hypothetical protein
MPLLIDSFNKILSLTSPTTDYDLQTLHDEVQDFLASPIGAIEDGVAAQWDAKGEIFKPEGKIEDPTNPGVFSQIILLLNPEWQIQFWPNSGYTRIFGGKLVGGVGDEPFKATGAAGDITVLESPVDGVTVAVGSGLDITQANQLETIHKLLGLDKAVTITITPSNISSDDADIDIDLTGDGITSTTMDRQP